MTCHCGCCSGVEVKTPVAVYNPPLRPAIRYRVGTHGAFRETMQARLSAYDPLAGLTTRDGTDPAIAILDCFAVIGDILTFYSERIATEGYLRTATDPWSLIRLAALVGYHARPALGATTVLAFSLDPEAATRVPAGSGARSIPKQDELPQTFETANDLEARAEWNTLTPAMTTPPKISYYRRPNPDAADDAWTIPTVTIAGTAANLKPGDRILFHFGPAPDVVVRVVSSVKPDFPAGITAVALVSDRTPLARARDALRAALANADPVPAGETAAAGYLKDLTDLVTGAPATTPATQVADLADLIDRLTESAALAAARDQSATIDWYHTKIGPVLEAARRKLRIAETVVRLAPAAALGAQQLAHRTLCPPGNGDLVVDDADCEAGAALVSLTPMLPWLRRPPSRPPRALRDAVPELDTLFAPDSDAHAKLLVAADARLAPTLHTALSHATLTAPPALTDMLVLRTKATVGKDNDTSTTVMLDTVYDGIHVGDWVVVGDNDPRRVKAVVQSEREVEVGETKVPVPATQLTVDTALRARPGAAVYTQGEPLTPVGEPITDDIGGATMELDRVYDGLTPGRLLVVAGERTDIPLTNGIQAAELAMVAGVRQRLDPGARGSSVRTVLQLSGELSYTYRRDTVRIHGNVVDATQGETRREVLGGGDAGRPNQSFPVRQADAAHPLTYLPANNPAGADDTLDVTVSGARWRPTELLSTATDIDRVYGVEIAADHSLRVQFGDGVHGARPHTGVDNVTATLRVGAGSGGNVVAGQISQLATRPLGVGGVTNPLPATGGADGDGPADMRDCTPLRMLALDRLVSVRDYADFSRARAGIAKADARKLSDGHRQVVHVTVAGIGDVPIDPSSGLLTALHDSLVDFGDVGLPVVVDVRERIMLVVRAGIKVTDDHDWAQVEPAVRGALLEAFSFQARGLAQNAYLTEVIAVIAAVPGVDYVDVDVFDGIPADATPLELITLNGRLDTPQPVVPAHAAEFVELRDTVEEDETLTGFALRQGLSVEELCALNPTLPGVGVVEDQALVVYRGLRPAQIGVLPPGVPEALTLRRIP